MVALESLSFAWPAAAFALPLPWLLCRLWPAAAGPALRVPDLAAFTATLPKRAAAGEGTAAAIAAPATRSPRLPAVFAALAWLALVIAAMRPQLVDPAQAAPASGRELMIALDVSASMGTPDMRAGEQTMTRLQAARALAAEFVARRDGDRIGLIVFGSQAYLHTPLTFDLAAVQAALGGVEVGLAGRETALGDALALAARRVAEHRDSARVLIVLTDGAHNAGALTPEQALWLAQREGLRLFTVGLGAPAASTAGDAAGGVGRDLRPEDVRSDSASTDARGTADPAVASAANDPEGPPVAPTALDEKTLRMLAEQSGGLYWRATDAASLAEFYRRVDALEPVAAADSARRAVEVYAWPLGAALLLALPALLAASRRSDTTRSPAGEAGSPTAAGGAVSLARSGAAGHHARFGEAGSHSRADGAVSSARTDGAVARRAAR